MKVRLLPKVSTFLLYCVVLTPLSHTALAQPHRPLPITAPTEDRAPVYEQTELGVQERHRQPSEALEFMANFNRQLDLDESALNEKNQLMATSSHTFFRATPALFYHDLQSVYRPSAQLLDQPAPTVRIVGDAHALNAGTFRGPDGKTVWGLNDFDQAEYGSPESDLERMGVSLYIAARSGGESPESAMRLVETMARSYIEHLDEGGPAYLSKEQTSGKIRSLIKKSSARSQHDLLEKWTVGDKLMRDERLVDPEPARGVEVRAALDESFPDLTIHDLASKPHSGGSTRGLERYYALVSSPDRKEPWLLEAKAVLPSPVQIPDADLSRGDGQHIIEFQRLMGGITDDRNGHFRLGEISFFTREREPEKGSLKDKPSHVEDSAASLGRLLARTHHHSGADLRAWVDGQEDKLITNLVDFSRRYARQVESDFREWKRRYSH